jgi:ureidoglycolate lyase
MTAQRPAGRRFDRGAWRLPSNVGRQTEHNPMSHAPFRRDLLIGGAAATAALLLETGAVTVPRPAQAADLNHVLPAEPLTPEAFAPFGTVLTAQGRPRLPIDTYGDRMDLYREPFESDQPIEWFIITAQPRWMGVLFLERHMQITQTFTPIGGVPFVTVVAAPDAPEHDGRPALTAMRAFVVPGDAAIQIHRGTWHENPMPTQVNQRLLVTSHQALTRGHQANPDARLAALPLDLERRFYLRDGIAVAVDLR